MKKGIKKVLAVLLSACIIFTCMQSIPALADDTNTNGVTTSTYNFNEASQADAFQFYKKNSADTAGSVVVNGTEGYVRLGAESSDTNKRVLLKEELNVKSVSADVFPDGETGKVNGGILIGDTGSSQASIYASTAVEFRLIDNNTNDTYISLYVTRYNSDNNKADTNILQTKTGKLQTTNASAPMRMTIDIAGDYALVTVRLVSDTTKSWQTVVDITKDKDGNASGYTGEAFSGRVGLSATQLGACFDNLTVVSYATNETAYNFNATSQADAFQFYKKNSADTAGSVVVNGTEGYVRLGAESSDTNKRVLLKEELNVKSVSADIFPDGETGKVNGGILLGDTGSNQASIYASTAVEFRLIDNNTNDTYISLYVTRYNSGQSKNILQTKTGKLQTTNASSPMRMTVDILGDYALVTVRLVSDTTKSWQTLVDITKDKDGNASGYTGEAFSGRVGFSATQLGACFDNLTVTSVKPPEQVSIYKQELLAQIEAWKTLEQGGYSDSTWGAYQTALANAITVSESTEATDKVYLDALDALRKAYNNLSESELAQSTTKTYTFEQLEDALDFDFYHSATGGFMVQDGKLVQNKADGEAKAILKGKNRTYESVSVDIYPDENGKMYSGIYLGASNAASPVDSINSVAIFIQTYDDNTSNIMLGIGTFPEWAWLKKVFINAANGNAILTAGTPEPLNLRVDIDGKNLTITLTNINHPDKFVRTTYEYTGDYDLAKGAVGLRSVKTANALDNFQVVYQGGTDTGNEIGGGSSNDTTTGSTGTTQNAPVPTGDNRGFVVLGYSLLAVVSCATIIFLERRRRQRV